MVADAQIGFQICENLFAIYFTFELGVRFQSFKKKMDCLKDGWFKFDLILVGLMVLLRWLSPSRLSVGRWL